MSEHGQPPGGEAEEPATILGRAANGIERVITPIYRWLGYGAAVVIGLVVVAMIYSAIGRRLGHPLNGSGDITKLGFLLMIAAALGVEHLGHEKMTVDVLVKAFPKKLHAWIEPLIFVLVLVILVISVWQLVTYGVSKQETGEVTQGTLHLIKYPFVYVLSFGMFTLIPIYLARLLHSVDRLVKR